MIDKVVTTAPNTLVTEAIIPATLTLKGGILYGGKSTAVNTERLSTHQVSGNTTFRFLLSLLWASGIGHLRTG